jgi:peptide methionine sulfoxide reductase msrA/msrB
MKLMNIFKGDLFLFVLTISQFGCAQNTENTMIYNALTPEEEQVIIGKGTERPFTGEYLNHKEAGTYTCKRCSELLYRSRDKFDSNCGWPSFDDEIAGAVNRIPDPDGIRTEIVCANCGGHLGHVFEGERFTDKNIRHCVNSISLNFIPDTETTENMTGRAIFAGGCFWGVEYYLEKHPGVISVVSGYIGGHTKNPTYEEVCTGRTGHAEAVEVIFDPLQTTYEEVARVFFEIHDPTQVNRQGPDIGEQYRSEIFYLNDVQKQTAEKLIRILEEKGYRIATRVTKATEFYAAEKYHQDYYANKGTLPYCHGYTKRF